MMNKMLGCEHQIRISVGGYHTCLSRREQGFESPIRNNNLVFIFVSGNEYSIRSTEISLLLNLPKLAGITVIGRLPFL